MLQLVSLWGQMSVKPVTADHADPTCNHVGPIPQWHRVCWDTCSAPLELRKYNTASLALWIYVLIHDLGIHVLLHKEHIISCISFHIISQKIGSFCNFDWIYVEIFLTLECHMYRDISTHTHKEDKQKSLSSKPVLSLKQVPDQTNSMPDRLVQWVRQYLGNTHTDTHTHTYFTTKSIICDNA